MDIGMDGGVDGGLDGGLDGEADVGMDLEMDGKVERALFLEQVMGSRRDVPWVFWTGMRSRRPRVTIRAFGTNASLRE
jgi:hypothetical protein